jgi:hypothetical protein
LDRIRFFLLLNMLWIAFPCKRISIN